MNSHRSVAPPRGGALPRRRSKKRRKMKVSTGFNISFFLICDTLCSVPCSVKEEKNTLMNINSSGEKIFPRNLKHGF